ncbi:MAG: hypothetical protein ACYS8X_00840 [Planctomycetota bacterium]|jgi:membrane protein YqaA with SNARE-associated domain
MPDGQVNVMQPPVDDIRVRHWFAAYGVMLLAAGVPLAMLVAGHADSWRVWVDDFLPTFSALGSATKLLAMGIFLSLCCTALPLPTGWLVAALSMEGAAVGPGPWSTALILATVGGAASTIANLNDYHLFTWMLRHHRVHGVRRSLAYRVARRWVSRQPFLLLVIFNILPIPLDAVRMLAISARYPRLRFAAANFIGRFIRYGLIAALTYRMGKDGQIVVVVLLVIPAIVSIERVTAFFIRLRRRRKKVRVVT